MLTDKQSLLLCAFVIFGFLLSAILQILDNYMVIALLGLAFLAIIVNLFLYKKDDPQKGDNTDVNNTQ